MLLLQCHKNFAVVIFRLNKSICFFLPKYEPEASAIFHLAGEPRCLHESQSIKKTAIRLFNYFHMRSGKVRLLTTIFTQTGLDSSTKFL